MPFSQMASNVIRFLVTLLALFRNHGAAAPSHGAMICRAARQAIRAIEKSHATRFITMIHRQEKRSLFGFAVSRHIDLEDAQTIIAVIKDAPDDMPIDLVIHHVR